MVQPTEYQRIDDTSRVLKPRIDFTNDWQVIANDVVTSYAISIHQLLDAPNNRFRRAFIIKDQRLIRVGIKDNKAVDGSNIV